MKLSSEKEGLASPGRPKSTKVATSTAALIFVLIAAACGNSSGASSDAAADSPDGKAGLQRATEFVAAASAPPAGLDLPALSKKPATGITLISLENPVPAAVTKNNATEVAAKALGWNYERVTVPAGPEGPAKALQQAVAKKPQYINYSGTPSAAVRQGLAEAERAGIKIVPDSVPDPIMKPLISTNISGPPDSVLVGKSLADYAIADSGGKAHILVVSIPSFPTIKIFSDSVEKTVGENCPGCKVSVLDAQITDIGTKIPTSVVSALQKDPTIDYVYFGFGDMAQGVPAALKAAGMADRVKIGGGTPAAANLQALKTGTEEVWTGYAIGILGFRIVDMAARDSVGDDLAPAENTTLPSQLLTQNNINETPLDTNGTYVGVPDYEEQFKQLWLVN